MNAPQPIQFTLEGPQPLVRELAPGADYPATSLGPLCAAAQADLKALGPEPAAPPSADRIVSEPPSAIGTKMQVNARHDNLALAAFPRRMSEILDTTMPMNEEIAHSISLAKNAEAV